MYRLQILLVAFVMSLMGCHTQSRQQQQPGSIQGAWEAKAVADRDQRTTVPLSSNPNNDRMQLLITATDLHTISYDDRGLRTDIPVKYKFDGKRITTDKSGSVHLMDFDVLSVTKNHLTVLHVQDPPDPQENAPVVIYDRIDEKQLAIHNVSHIPQSVSVQYTFQGQQGTFKGEGEFRSSGNKSVNCTITTDGALHIQYIDMSEENGKVYFSTEKNNSVAFSISDSKFDFSKSEESVHRDVTGQHIFSIFDVANKQKLFETKDSKCSYDVTRKAKNVTVTGSCSGISSPTALDAAGKVSMNSSCEMEVSN